MLDCPGGTFQGAGVKTVVLFFIGERIYDGAVGSAGFLCESSMMAAGLRCMILHGIEAPNIIHTILSCTVVRLGVR